MTCTNYNARARAATLAAAIALIAFCATPAAAALQQMQPPPETDTGTVDADTAADSADADETTPPPAAQARPPQRSAAVQPARGDWPAYGHGNAATRYVPLDQIDRDNVGTLERVWAYRTKDMPPEGYDDKWAPETTPIKVGDALYLCSAMNILISLDAATGRERWRHDPEVSLDSIPYSASCRGVTWYEDPDLPDGAACKRRVVEGTLDARLIAVDADTGTPCADFGANGEVDLLTGMGETVPGYVAVTSPPTLVRGVLVVGHQVLDGQKESAPSGVIRGYDARTGGLVWAWDMGRPDHRGLPPPGEEYTRGTPNAWTIFAGDEELGLVYVPMGNSSVDYFGGNRRDFEEPYSTALVALDATTGEVRWAFQTVHHDVWDYDLGSQPSLIDFPTERGRVPAVLLPTKVGDLYVLDRRTGEPLTEVEERPVPQGGVAGDQLSPTQPFSVGMPNLPREPLEERDMWGMSPIDQLWCRIQYRRANYQGMYTPPSVDRHWIQYPGYNGGNDWGSAAVDTRRDVLVLNYNVTPMHNRLITREEADERGMAPLGEPGGSTKSGGGVPQAESPFAALIAAWRVAGTGLLCNDPPYGGIMAVDLQSRSVLWNRALGSAWANGPFGIPSRLPITIGTPNNGGPIVTAGGVIFIAATTDNHIRALDADTGETLWEDRLPAGGQATPITYMADGRQYVVMGAGGHHFMETPIGDYIIAYALPSGAAPSDTAP